VLLLLTAAAIALLAACFASGVCEAAAIAAAVGTALAVVVIGALRAAGVDVRGGPGEGPTAAAETPREPEESEMA
jgi:hypothetical protein